ncbi:MAG TPA: hypothetical protein VNW97_01850 [Candidatus Saccharimonadales bacterium]|jgi:hypothetical protein|nr:hypothetical protein [Candidatus Saccharimonadales bacterium]
MFEDVYKQAFGKAQTDLAHAIQQRDQWTMEVAKLQQLVKSLATMAAKDHLESMEGAIANPEIGLQEIVFTCIRMSPKPLTPVEVRDQLQVVGYDTSGYANPLAVIHGAINRLEKSGKITANSNGAYNVTPPRGITQPIARPADNREAIAAGLFEPKGKKK